MFAAAADAYRRGTRVPIAEVWRIALNFELVFEGPDAESEFVEMWGDTTVVDLHYMGFNYCLQVWHTHRPSTLLTLAAPTESRSRRADWSCWLVAAVALPPWPDWCFSHTPRSTRTRMASRSSTRIHSVVSSARSVWRGSCRPSSAATPPRRRSMMCCARSRWAT